MGLKGEEGVNTVLCSVQSSDSTEARALGAALRKNLCPLCAPKEHTVLNFDFIYIVVQKENCFFVPEGCGGWGDYTRVDND